MLGEAMSKARPANISSLKISFMMKTNILLITSVILLLHHITIASSASAIEEPRQFQFQVGEGDLTRTSSAEAAHHQYYLQEEDEGGDFEINVGDQQKQSMPPIIVSEVQESSQPSAEDIPSNFHRESNHKISLFSKGNDEDELNEAQSDEPLHARESRSNFIGIGIPNDNDDDDNNIEDELSTSYNNILLSPQGIGPFTPYSLINQQRQHLRNVLLQPMSNHNQPFLFRRVAPIQNAYLDEDRNAQPVNLIYVPASTLQQQNHHQPSVVLQELRSLQFHDKSPLLNVLFQPSSYPLQTNSVSWPSKYQADKYLPPDEAFSRLFARPSPPSHMQHPLDSFFRRFENPYENNHHQLQPAEPLNNFIGNQPFYQNSNLYHHRYVVPQVPFFSSNVPLSSNFPPLPYVSPSLRGYKSETTTMPPGDIDVRMSKMPEEFPQLPQPTQTQIDQPDNGLLSRSAAAGSERDAEETTESARIEQKNLEEISESHVKYQENEATTTKIVNGGNEQENNDDEKLNVDNVLKNVSVALQIEEISTQASATSTPVEKTVTLPAQSDENLIDSTTEDTTPMMESSTTTESSSDEVTMIMTTPNDELELTTMTMNSIDEMMTTTEKSS